MFVAAGFYFGLHVFMTFVAKFLLRFYGRRDEITRVRGVAGLTVFVPEQRVRAFRFNVGVHIVVTCYTQLFIGSIQQSRVRRGMGLMAGAALSFCYRRMNVGLEVLVLVMTRVT